MTGRRGSWRRYEARHQAEKNEALDAGCACTWDGAFRVAGTSKGCPVHDPALIAERVKQEAGS